MRKRRTERKNNILDTQNQDEMLFESTPLPMQQVYRSSIKDSFGTSPSLLSTYKNDMPKRSKSSIEAPFGVDGHDEDDKDVNLQGNTELSATGPPSKIKDIKNASL